MVAHKNERKELNYGKLEQRQSEKQYTNAIQHTLTVNIFFYKRHCATDMQFEYFSRIIHVRSALVSSGAGQPISRVIRERQLQVQSFSLYGLQARALTD